MRGAYAGVSSADMNKFKKPTAAALQKSGLACVENVKHILDKTMAWGLEISLHLTTSSS